MPASWVAFPLCIVLFWPASGQAKSSEDYGHQYEQIWRSAIRLIRVDQGFAITDRDKDVGYFMFEYKDGERGYPGSVELVETAKQGEGIRVLVQIPAMPSYIERMLLDKLSRKLLADYGEPPKRAPKPPASQDSPADDDRPAEQAPGKE